MTEPARLANTNQEEHRREIATKLNLALMGRLNTNSTVSLLSGTTSTVVNDPRIWAQTVPILVPLNALAAAIEPFVYVSSRADGTLTLTHPDPAAGVSFGGGTIPKGASWDGGSSALVAADCGEVNVYCAVAGTITGWTITTEGGTGSCVVDIWKRAFSAGMPTVAHTITASAKPTISSNNRAQSSTLTGWTTAISAGDILTFKVDSTSTFTNVTIVLDVAVSGGGGVGGGNAQFAVVLIG